MESIDDQDIGTLSWVLRISQDKVSAAPHPNAPETRLVIRLALPGVMGAPAVAAYLNAEYYDVPTSVRSGPVVHPISEDHAYIDIMGDLCLSVDQGNVGEFVAGLAQRAEDIAYVLDNPGIVTPLRALPFEQARANFERDKYSPSGGSSARPNYGEFLRNIPPNHGLNEVWARVQADEEQGRGQSRRPPASIVGRVTQFFQGLGL